MTGDVAGTERVHELETEVEQFQRLLNDALKDNHRLIGLLEKAARSVLHGRYRCHTPA